MNERAETGRNLIFLSKTARLFIAKEKQIGIVTFTLSALHTENQSVGVPMLCLMK